MTFTGSVPTGSKVMEACARVSNHYDVDKMTFTGSVPTGTVNGPVSNLSQFRITS